MIVAPEAVMKEGATAPDWRVTPKVGKHCSRAEGHEGVIVEEYVGVKVLELESPRYIGNYGIIHEEQSQPSKMTMRLRDKL